MDRLPTAYEMVCRKLDNAEKEIERLKKLVKEAFYEGHDAVQEGQSFDVNQAWDESDMQQALKEE